MNSTQKCGICKEEKDIETFTNNKMRVLKNCSMCREKQRNYYNKNKESRLEYGKKRNTERKEELKEYNAQYYKKNKDVILPKQIEYNKKKYNKPKLVLRPQFDDKVEKQSDKSSS
mgnify:CR=1 FL=1